jgi:opacity protein-like surface antigen
MNRLTRSLLAAATLCGATFQAEAADLSQPPRVLNYPAQVVDPGVSGWYLRGDVGVGIMSTGSWYETSVDSPQPNQTNGWLDRRINDTSTIDVGVGYQFTDNLRGDVTIGYRTATALHGGNYISNPNNNPTTGENSITGSVSSVVGLVNGYYDITRWNGLTPYVGVGIGAAYNTMGATSTQQGGFNPPEFGVYPSKGKANFAWALHTGLSYDINPRLKLEVGYSFMNLGETNAGPLTCYGGGTPVLCNDAFRIRNLTSQDIHIGMRWLLDVGASTSSSYQSSSSWGSSATTYQPSSSWQQSSTTTYQPGSYQSGSAPVVAKY